MTKPLTPDECSALVGYATMRDKGMNHVAAIAAVNLARMLADQDELTPGFVSRLKALAP